MPYTDITTTLVNDLGDNYVNFNLGIVNVVIVEYWVEFVRNVSDS